VLAALEAGMTREQILERVIGQAAEIADELLDDTLETAVKSDASDEADTIEQLVREHPAGELGRCVWPPRRRL